MLLSYWPFQPAANFKITSGTGISGISSVSAFDAALANAGISDYNLLQISSILPAGARESEALPRKGSMLPTAYAKMLSHTPGMVMATGVAIGIPRDKTKTGVIMEESFESNPYAQFLHGKVAEGHIEEARMGVHDMLLKRLDAEVRDAMARRGTELEDVRFSVNSIYVPTDEFYAIVSAVALW